MIPSEPRFELLDGRNDLAICDLSYMVNTVRDIISSLLDMGGYKEMTVPYLIDVVEETESFSIAEVHSALLELVDEGTIVFDNVMNIIRY